MNIRVVRCGDESHELSWIKASECSHWQRCPRAKKAKKAGHKLVPGEPGFVVANTGLDSTAAIHGWPYGYAPPPYVLELVEQRYLGRWVYDETDVGIDRRGPGSQWVPASVGPLLTCKTECGFMCVVM